MLHEKSGQIRKSTYNKLFHLISTPYQHVFYTPPRAPPESPFLMLGGHNG